MKIIGIDPGYGRVGIGIIEGSHDQWKSVFYTCIETDPKATFSDRIHYIYKELKTIVSEYKPDIAAVEELFFNKNTTTAMRVAEARGAILLTLQQAGLSVCEYTPLQVKQAIVGHGRAEKHQIQHMIPLQLGLKGKKIQDDAADALAVALTCGVMTR